MVRIVATRYLAGLDYSIKPGDVINEAPFNLPEDVLTDFINKGQATAIAVQVVEESPKPEEYDVLVLDEDGEEVMNLADEDDEEEEGKE